jgi:hypothetical protein
MPRGFSAVLAGYQRAIIAIISASFAPNFSPGQTRATTLAGANQISKSSPALARLMPRPPMTPRHVKAGDIPPALCTRTRVAESVNPVDPRMTDEI